MTPKKNRKNVIAQLTTESITQLLQTVSKLQRLCHAKCAAKFRRAYLIYSNITNEQLLLCLYCKKKKVCTKQLFSKNMHFWHIILMR